MDVLPTAFQLTFCPANGLPTTLPTLCQPPSNPFQRGVYQPPYNPPAVGSRLWGLGGPLATSPPRELPSV